MADTFQEARDAIHALIVPAWNTATGSAPLAYDNKRFTSRPDSIWGRVTLRFQNGTRASLGGAAARFRYFGTVYVQIFVPLDSGMTEVTSAAQAVADAINQAGHVDGNVWFRDVQMKEVGSDEAYFQINVEAGFTFDQT